MRAGRLSKAGLSIKTKNPQSWTFSQASLKVNTARYDGMARGWRDGQWRENTTLATEGFVRDVVAKDRDHWLILSQPSQEETVLYEYTAGKLRPVGRLTGKFEKPTLHPAADGRVWITSAEGRLMP